jgi:hypothetical protein
MVIIITITIMLIIIIIILVSAWKFGCNEVSDAVGDCTDSDICDTIS